MKKYYLISLVVSLVLFLFTGCNGSKYKFIQPIKNIIKIEYVIVGERKNPDNLPLSKVPHELKIVSELSNYKINDFIKDLVKVEFHYIYTDPVTIEKGELAVKISYKNGDYELISANSQAKYVNENYKSTGRYSFDNNQFQGLLDKYSYDN